MMLESLKEKWECLKETYEKSLEEYGEFRRENPELFLCDDLYEDEI